MRIPDTGGWVSKQGLDDLRRRNLSRTLRVIVLGPVYSRTHRIFLHQPCIEWLETISNARRICDARIQPQIVVFRLEDHGHPIMHAGNELVRLCGEDGASFNNLASRISPAFPNTCEGKN